MDFPLLAILALVICNFVFAFALWSKHRTEGRRVDPSDTPLEARRRMSNRLDDD